MDLLVTFCPPVTLDSARALSYRALPLTRTNIGRQGEGALTYTARVAVIVWILWRRHSKGPRVRIGPGPSVAVRRRHSKTARVRTIRGSSSPVAEIRTGIRAGPGPGVRVALSALRTPRYH